MNPMLRDKRTAKATFFHRDDEPLGGVGVMGCFSSSEATEAQETFELAMIGVGDNEL